MHTIGHHHKQILAIITLLIIPALASACSPVVARSASDEATPNHYNEATPHFPITPTYHHTTFLPLIHTPGYARPPLQIYDLDGNPQDWSWLTETFGDVQISRGNGTASVAVLQAIEGPAAILVTITDPAGQPLEATPVVFHWTDAPELPPDYHNCGLTRGIVGLTNWEGHIGFAMGGGAYYLPPDGGPHTIWIPTHDPDCLAGLGMLGFTNHIHLDPTYRVNPVIARRPQADEAIPNSQYTKTLTHTIRGMQVPIIYYEENAK